MYMFIMKLPFGTFSEVWSIYWSTQKL